MQSSNRLGDILANAITHGIGAGLAIAGATYMLVAASHTTTRHLVCCAIFATTLILVYLCSTLYHSLVMTRARHVFHILDHSSIYLLIAGTYTPFTLVTLRGATGWTIFTLEWVLAIGGVVFKSLAVDSFETLSSVVYLLQGWFIIVAFMPLVHALGLHGTIWLMAGGLAYSLGVIFFVLDRLRYFHALWHLFVLAGSFFHYFAILFYVLPAAK